MVYSIVPSYMCPLLMGDLIKEGENWEINKGMNTLVERNEVECNDPS